MAKKIKFALKLKDDTEVRTIEELREHFDLERIIGYYQDGDLFRWLQGRDYLDEAKQVEALAKTSGNIGTELCRIFGVEIEESALDSLDAESIKAKNERIALLKQYSDGIKAIDNVDRVAFNQEELSGLIDSGVSEIYLCTPRIKLSNMMLKREGIHFIGIGKVEVIIESKKVIDFDALGIKFENVSFDEAYKELLGKRKEISESQSAPKKAIEKKCATEEMQEKPINPPKEEGKKQFIAKIGGLALLSEKVKTSGKLKFKFSDTTVYGTIIYERDMGIHAEPTQRIEIGVELSQPTPLKVRTQFEIINIHTKITEGKITRLCDPFSVLDKENQKIFEQGLKYEAFNIPEAKKYYEIAAKAGYVAAIKRLISLYKNTGYETPETREKAKYWSDRLLEILSSK